MKFETDQQRKDNRLFNILECIDASMKESKIFPPPEAYKNCYSRPEFDREAAKELTKKLCKDLWLRGKGDIIYVVDETSSFMFNIESVPDILQRFKRELSINWDKVYYHEKGGETRGWERVITPKFQNTSPPKEYWLKTDPRNLAENHDSLEDFKNDQDQVNCRENLQTAINGLAMLKQNAPGEKAQIKGLENMVKLWQSHVDQWDKALKIAERTDYVLIKKYRDERKIDKLAETNEAIKLLEPQIETIQKGWISARKIYDLFKSNGLEPENDLDLYVTLKVAHAIKIEGTHETEWSEDEEGKSEIKSRKVTLKWTGFDHYLKEHTDDLSLKQSAFGDKYCLKRNGDFKSVSHRERGYRDQQSSEIEKAEKFLNLVIKNEFQIKKYLSQ